MTAARQICLSINLNRIALLRNSRRNEFPDLAQAARTVVHAGAQGITVHPRPDERHITAADVLLLQKLIDDAPTEIEFNIEGYPDQRFFQLVDQVNPTQVTLVPDAPEQFTSDHGWDMFSQREIILPALQRIHKRGIRSALFCDPDPVQVGEAARLGANRIELYTESYAKAFGTSSHDTVLGTYQRSAEAALSVDLGVNAGHDLNLSNLPEFSQLPGLLECSIGHAVVSDAVFTGLAQAVRLYGQAITGNPVETPWYP